jgi:predicted HD phosphohydrolase
VTVAVVTSSAYRELVRLLTEPEYADWRDPNDGRNRVTALDHARQAATRAERAGAGDDEIAMALVHDAARPLSDVFHGAVIAEIMRDHLRADCYHALVHHGTFQGDIVHLTTRAERWREEFWYPTAKRLATWDAASFDPRYRAESIDHFLPMLSAVMA